MSVRVLSQSLNLIIFNLYSAKSQPKEQQRENSGQEKYLANEKSLWCVYDYYPEVWSLETIWALILLATFYCCQAPLSSLSGAQRCACEKHKCHIQVFLKCFKALVFTFHLQPKKVPLSHVKKRGKNNFIFIQNHKLKTETRSAVD